MPASRLDEELNDVLSRLRSEYDAIPFMLAMHSSATLRLIELPQDMHGVISSSSDFSELLPGAAPTWVRLTAMTPDAPEAELVLYRARADDRYYVVAPDPPSPQSRASTVAGRP